MMQRLDRGDQVVQVKRATKSDCEQPCAEISDAYQKDNLKNDVRRAFESRNSYSHGTRPHSTVPFYHATRLKIAHQLLVLHLCLSGRNSL